MTTRALGFSFLAAATSWRIVANDRGTTRRASVRPVTERPWKSAISRPPAARNRSPPRPNTSMSGSRRRSAATSAPAYRSPDASPHDSMRRVTRPAFALGHSLGFGGSCSSQEVRRQQVDALDRNALVGAEAHTLEIADKLVGVADEDNRQLRGPDEPARDALNLIGRHAQHAFPIPRQLLHRQLVEQLVEDLRGNGVGHFNRQREVTHHVVLSAQQLLVVDPFALQARKFIYDHT